jgi:predicted Holliday junction resolvase-like endonuclease
MKERLSRKMQEIIAQMRARITKIDQKELLMPVEKWTEKEVKQRIEEIRKDSVMLGKPENLKIDCSD